MQARVSVSCNMRAVFRFYFGMAVMKSRVLPKTAYLFDCERATCMTIMAVHLRKEDAGLAFGKDDFKWYPRSHFMKMSNITEKRWSDRKRVFVSAAVFFGCIGVSFALAIAWGAAFGAFCVIGGLAAAMIILVAGTDDKRSDDTY